MHVQGRLIGRIPNTRTMKFLMISQTEKSKQVNSKYLTNVFRKQTDTSNSY